MPLSPRRLSPSKIDAQFKLRKKVIYYELCAYIAPDDFHMGISKSGKIFLCREKKENGLRPAVSYLFRSLAHVYGSKVIGMLLTGMGTDGANELKLLKEKGAVTIAQDKESSIVHGMPGEAIKLGAASYVLSPDQIVKALEDWSNKERVFV